VEGHTNTNRTKQRRGYQNTPGQDTTPTANGVAVPQQSHQSAAYGFCTENVVLSGRSRARWAVSHTCKTPQQSTIKRLCRHFGRCCTYRWNRVFQHAAVGFCHLIHAPADADLTRDFTIIVQDVHPVRNPSRPTAVVGARTHAHVHVHVHAHALTRAHSHAHTRIHTRPQAHIPLVVEPTLERGQGEIADADGGPATRGAIAQQSTQRTLSKCSTATPSGV